MNGTYKNLYNCIYVLESSPYFAHEPLENLWHQFSILPVSGVAGWSWLWNGCHWHCRSRPLRGDRQKHRSWWSAQIGFEALRLQDATGNSHTLNINSFATQHQLCGTTSWVHFRRMFRRLRRFASPRPRRWSGPPSLNGLLRLRHFGCLPRAERDGMRWDDLNAFEEVS